MLDEPVGTGVRVVLVRHGRTAWNAQGRFLGHTDLALDELGLAQAEALSEALRGRFVRVFSSPAQRAMQTAAGLGATVISEEALRELDQGALEGLTAAEAVALHPEFFAAWQADPGGVQVPGGGRLGLLAEAAQAWLVAQVAAAAPGETLVVVSHQLVIASLCCGLLGEPLKRWRRYRARNVGLTVLDVVEGQYMLRGLDLCVIPASLLEESP